MVRASPHLLLEIVQDLVHLLDGRFGVVEVDVLPQLVEIEVVEPVELGLLSLLLAKFARSRT